VAARGHSAHGGLLRLADPSGRRFDPSIDHRRCRRSTAHRTLLPAASAFRAALRGRRAPHRSAGRPQSVDEGSTSNTEGIDIVLAIDISTSMLAQDLQPDRIQAAKQVAGNFITDRPGDRIGLVAFAGEAFTQSPLTTDQGTLQTLLGRLRSGVVRTARPSATDWRRHQPPAREQRQEQGHHPADRRENNRGEIAPLTAAEIARDQGIRVYTIGVGTRGTAPYPTVDFFGNPTVVQAKVQIDEKILGEIADLTGGRYFRATDNAKTTVHLRRNQPARKRARSKYRNTPPTPRSTSAGQRRLWPCCSWNFCCVPSG